MGTTFVPTFWFKLVQMFTRLMNSINLRPQHLAGAFFLALVPDNIVELLRLSYDQGDEKCSLAQL